MDSLILTLAQDDVRTLLKLVLVSLLAIWAWIRFYRAVKADEQQHALAEAYRRQAGAFITADDPPELLRQRMAYDAAVLDGDEERPDAA